MNLRAALSACSKCITAITVICCAFANSPSAVAAPKTVYIATGEFPPYLSQDLANEGIGTRIVTEAFASVGIEVVYGYFPWNRSYQAAKRGQDWHGTILWVFTEERAKHFLYSDPVVTETEVLFHLTDRPIEWEKIEDLQGLVIGGTEQTVYPVLEQAEARGILFIERAGNYDQLFKRLLFRRLDAVPMVKGVGKYFLDNNLSAEERDRISAAEKPIGERWYHLILSKSNPENALYLRAFNEGLRKLKSSGRLAELMSSLETGTYGKPDS